MEIGDIVTLKSEAYKIPICANIVYMTVEDIFMSENSDVWVTCSWFDKNFMFRKQMINKKILTEIIND